jgi:hypothetical protein
MSLSRVTYTSDGSTTQYDITFQYISSTHVKVTVYDADGVSNPIDIGFTFVNPTRVQLTGAPAAGKKIRLYNGISATVPYVDFTNGAELNEKSLDDNSKALLMVAQRAIDDASDGLAALGQVENSRSIAEAAATSAALSETNALASEGIALNAAANAAAYTTALLAGFVSDADASADAAELARAAAVVARIEAEGFAASVNLPVPTISNAGESLVVDSTGAFALGVGVPGYLIYAAGVR